VTDAFGAFSVTVPAGRIFVLGDARNVAVDSRSHLADQSGTLAVEQVVGPAVAVASPPWRARLLGGVADAPLLLPGTALAGAGVVMLVIAVWPGLRRLGQAIPRRRSKDVVETTGRPI
jgi:signal peptidase I